MNHLPTRSFTRRHAQTPRKQSGAVAVIVALSLVGLIGFVGLALDLGKLFIAKTELQNSADACALAAARELTGANTNQLKLAEAAGIATGERHNVYFQNEQIKISSVTFSDTLAGNYGTADAFTGTKATEQRYARCEASKSGIGNWFIQVLNLVPGVAIGDQTVAAAAVATLSPSQQTFSSCPLPVAVCESSLEKKKPGDWVGSLLDPGEGMTGDFLWAPFPNDQDNGTKDIKDILTGKEECSTPIDNQKVQKVGDPGRKQGAFDAWNTRFGLYKSEGNGNGTYNASNAKPDLTGFAYTAKSWPSCEKAFASGDFSLQREKNVPFQDKKNESDSTGLKIPVDPSDSLTHSKGADRRLAIVPVVNCDEFESGSGNGKGKGSGSGHEATITKWACVLMLHPLDSGAKSTDPAFACPTAKGIKDSTMLLEFIGLANDPLSPCASNGVVGGPGSAGPLVPVLVR
ncbi:Tad domain-containing protein [Nitrosomonas communis]|uniref:Tad domain-containing protein n=1 Tax=Nitrosomonas communis TaxID=44574 RepID=UPI0026EC0170|nr:Tad domain-containing protein [Nitrosomonas communis]MCO6428420.1 Tad domain-containing protein [Nitrosomonas communis]